MKKRRKWYEKHHDDCMAFRAKFGVKEGDGFKRLAEMKKGSEIECELAATLERTARAAFWSMDFFDAYMAAMPHLRK